MKAVATRSFAAGDFTVAADHPCLAGHFPGRPILPGVVLLDEVLCRIRKHVAANTPLTLDAVKFTAPVLPGQNVRVVLRMGSQGRVGFTCEVEGARVMFGTATFPATA